MRSSRQRTICKADDLTEMNNIINNHLSEDCSLENIVTTVKAAISVLYPFKKIREKDDKQRLRLKKLDRKIKIVRQQASWYQCIIDVLKGQEKPSKKIRAMMEELRTLHHTICLPNIQLLKQKAVDKIRSLAAARKKLTKRQMWIEDNQ